jgi:hypothetical protein
MTPPDEQGAFRIAVSGRKSRKSCRCDCRLSIVEITAA